jgi:hypothetical protein
MQLALAPFAIRHNAVWIRNEQLPAQRVQHGGWDIQGVLQEGAQKSNRGQLQGKTQAIVLPSLLRDEREVGIIQVEIARQIIG